MNRPSLPFEEKITEAGFSVSFFWDSIDFIVRENIYTESNELEDVAKWFFFSQVFFLVTAKHPVFRNAPLKMQLGDLHREVTALSYFLVSFARGSVDISPIAIFLTGEEGDASVVESFLKNCYGEDRYHESFTLSSGLLAELVENKKKTELESMVLIKAPVLLSLLKRLDFSASDYLAGCRMNMDVFGNLPDGRRGQKMFFYWKILFYGLAFPGESDIKGRPLVSPFITQGNLNNLEFAILHYMLLWKSLSSKDPKKAGDFFSCEARGLAVMTKEELSSDDLVPGEELQIFLNLIRIKVGDFKYVEALHTVTEAMNYISGSNTL